ncbi:MAG: carbon starvation CstA family protein [Caldisericum sp.]|uniref:carbon starvation CstA family protein n=1 Tax=Caldisericum sp. TaxID=2499687 RepID=UPI003D09DCA6
MYTGIIVLVGAIFYLFFYFTYGKSLEKNVVKADPNKETPAVRLRDNVDYVPANKFVLFGHHFASIAGAGPIVGPAIAVVWGWLPALLWVWFGNLFIGSVHDYLALMASVRYDGKSIQWVAGELMGKDIKYVFELYVYFAMILVIAAFMGVFGPLANSSPEILTASLLFMVAALIEGQLLYKTKLPFWLSSAIGVVLTILAIYLGFVFPWKVSLDALYWGQLIYIVLAASLPVWFLLQPRDYLNSYILWGGVIIGMIAALIVFKPFNWPAFTSFSANVVSPTVPSPFWPTIPLVIACGALSGFHSIVGSGTSSKQLDNELSGLFVGYGAMFMEGMVSTLVITSIGAFGLGIIQGFKDVIAQAKPGIDAMQLSNPSYMAQYGNLIINLKDASGKAIVGGAGGLFTKSFGELLKAAYGVPARVGIVLGGLWLSAFVLTTLDTTNRLARYAFQELVEPLKNVSKGLHDIFHNRWVASIIAAALGFFLIRYGGNAYTALWAGFAGTNQMLASIALLTGANWVKRVQKVSGGTLLLVLIPAMFLWLTVFVALIWYLIKVVPAQAAAIRPILGAFVVIEIVLAVYLLVGFFRTYNKEYKPLMETGKAK